MATPEDWIRGYSRQADKDLSTWELLCEFESARVPECHRLLFLQMACEKLCKAHLIEQGTPPEAVQSSHGYVSKPLPIVLKGQIRLLRAKPKGNAALLVAVRQFAQEIELLNPSIDRNGQRPDNCEYPWEDAGGRLHSPLDTSFQPSQLRTARWGRTIIKLLRSAIDELL